MCSAEVLAPVSVLIFNAEMPSLGNDAHSSQPILKSFILELYAEDAF